MYATDVLGQLPDGGEAASGRQRGGRWSSYCCCSITPIDRRIPPDPDHLIVLW